MGGNFPYRIEVEKRISQEVLKMHSYHRHKTPGGSFWYDCQKYLEPIMDHDTYIGDGNYEKYMLLRPYISIIEAEKITKEYKARGLEILLAESSYWFDGQEGRCPVTFILDVKATRLWIEAQKLLDDVKKINFERLYYRLNSEYNYND